VANAPATTPLARRVELSLKEGRIPQALELAKQFARQEPGLVSEALVRKCFLRAAEAQVNRGAFRDAHSVLTEAEKVSCEDPAWWERLAELRADVGDHSRALQLLDKVPDVAARPRILGRLADRAIKEGSSGRAMVPDDLKPQFESVRKAFVEYEAGRDEPAREALNAIGLGSPFLEWKLLLRGLMAWSTNDTPRAFDNWSRLSPDRLPAKLAAPIRFAADKAFASSLPADRHAVVSKQAEQLTGGLTEGLRRLRKQVVNEDMLPAAFETARTVVPELNRHAADLIPRLANVMYWSILSDGQPEDVPRYLRLFGQPADDPSFHRLQAMVAQNMRRLDMAHGFWGKYEEWIAKSPNRWPPAQAARARALILERMGQLAHDWLEDEGEDDDLDDFFSMFSRNRRRAPVQRKPLKPSAEECFRQASELAPDRVGPAMSLLKEFASNPEKAAIALQEVLQRFPNDLTILQQAASFYERIEDAEKARECIRKAFAANPLDRELTAKVASFAFDDARQLAVAKDYEAALAAMKQAGSLGSQSMRLGVHALAAAMYTAAKKPEEAGKHLETLRNAPNARLVAAYRLAVEGARVKVKKSDLSPWQEAFETELQAEATPAETSALLDAMIQYLGEPTRYRGHKAHQTKILDRVRAIGEPTSKATEAEREQFGLALHRVSMWKVLGEFALLNRQSFPANAYFAFFEAEAKIARSKAAYVSGQTGYAYRRVKNLMKVAKDGRYQALQELLDARLKKNPDLERWLSGYDIDYGW